MANIIAALKNQAACEHKNSAQAHLQKKSLRGISCDVYLLYIILSADEKK
jgi:hypothetical protein